MTTDTPRTLRAGERQLFLDDDGITHLERLTRTAHQPTKKGAVIRIDLDDPGQEIVQIRSAPAWDPDAGVYKLWTITTPEELAAQGIPCAGYYESADGLHWSKPIVGQVEYRGSLQNNYITVPTDEGYVAPTHVVYDPTDPDPARRYKAAMTDSGFLTSPDGVAWTLLDVPKVPSQDESNLSFDQQAHLFLHTVKHRGPYGRSVWLSTSEDFAQWTEPELMFHADDRDQEIGRARIEARLANPTLQPMFTNDPSLYNVEVYNMGLFRYEGLYIGLPSMFHSVGPYKPDYPNTEGFHLVHMAWSRDLKTWQRLDERPPFIGPSPSGAGAYDMTQMIGPSAPVVHGDSLWFYYTCVKYRGATNWVDSHTVDADLGAICLAVLRRDGFVSLDAGNATGVLVTEPFRLMGEKLYANVTAVRGELQAELLGRDGTVLALSERMRGDLLRGELEWQQGDLASQQGKDVKLRFRARHASFYSYWFE
ncbi:MAG: hypothetical protein CL878_04620 [Dehalococcoidia bacterium]|nr:hypothetical protein [Dehalococcoidia bacterium]